MTHNYLLTLLLIVSQLVITPKWTQAATPEFSKLLEEGKDAFDKGKYKQAFRYFAKAKEGASDSLDYAKYFLAEGEARLLFGELEKIKDFWKNSPSIKWFVGADSYEYTYLYLKKAGLMGELEPFFIPLEEIIPDDKSPEQTIEPQTLYFKKMGEYMWMYHRLGPSKAYYFLEDLIEWMDSEEIEGYLRGDYWTELAYMGDGVIRDDSVQMFLAKAEEAYMQSWGESHVGKTEYLVVKSKILNLAGKYSKSVELSLGHEELLERYNIGKHVMYPDLWKVRAAAYREMGDPERGLTLCKKAVLKMEQWFPQGHRNMGTFYNTLASCYDDFTRGDRQYKRFVIGLSKKAIDIDRQNKVNPYRPAMFTHNLALHYKEMGMLDSAHQFFLECRDTLIKYLGPDHLDVAKSRMGLGEVLIRMKRLPEAIEQARIANKVFEKKVPLGHNAMVRSNLILGYYLYWARELPEAEEYLTRAYRGYFPDLSPENVLRLKDPKYFKAHDFQNLTNIFAMLGALYGTYRRSEKGVEYLEKAAAMFEVLIAWIDQYEMRSSFREGGWILRYNYEQDYSSWLFYIYDLYLKTGDKKYIDLAFAVIDKCKTRSIRYQIQGNKALKFSDQLENELERGEKFQEAYTLLEEKILKSRSYKNSLIMIDSLVYEYEQKRQLYFDWKKSVEKKYPEYFKLKYDQHLVYPDEVRRKLDMDNTLVIEYFYEEKFYLYVSSLSRDRATFTAFDVNGELSTMIDEFTDMVGKTSNAENLSFDMDFYRRYLNVSHSLYSALIQCVVDTFTDKKYDKLLIIPHGKIAKVPFDLLLTQMPDSQVIDYRSLPYLIKDYEVRYEYAAALINTKAKIGLKSKIPYVGIAPDFEGDGEGNERAGISELMFNKLEVQKAFKQFGGKKLEGNRVYEGRVKKYISKASILHFATHTILDDSLPMNSSLILSKDVKEDEDGYLHAFEIYPIELQSDLAVLSACETGLGKFERTEGMMSLARAFKYAGCPNIVMSLWRADDESTSEIIPRFFAYIQQGMSKSSALRQAKLDYLDQASSKQFPYYWDSFILIGDDQPVVIQSERTLAFKWWYLLLIAAALVPILLLVRIRVRA
ncbi:MAG: CHAT domain-containing protein [Bacteroidia bacterium]|nr:CHAT domain-containing protein [Bacteroidia bacterium]